LLGYILRRLVTAPISLLIVIGVTFLILRTTGDPVQIYLDINSTPEQEAILRARLHLDESLFMQFIYYLRDLATGDFGRSLRFSAPAMSIVMERLGYTLQLIAGALVLATVLGALGGIVSALNKDRLPDFVISSIAVAGQSMPSFWLGILLVQFFALYLGWLPTSGTGSWLYLILPTVTLATFLLPNFVLITRASMLETMGELYVVTARAKGLPRWRVIFGHVLPNAINPTLSFLGLQLGRLVGGSVITETIFAWPGIGRLMISSIFQRDAPVVIAAVFVTSIAIILANLLVDILLSLTDPRVRLD
jgi:ABC-type dipeptide/oligopeptide/nickel transport system permease component